MSEQKYCGNCGSPLDTTTGKCPNCDMQTYQKENNPQSSKKKSTKKSNAPWVIIAALALLVAALVGGLVYVLKYQNAEKVTRYEWTKLLCEENNYDLDVVKNTDPIFEDVNKDDPYFPYIMAAYHWGVLDDSEKNFHGEEPATEQFVGITGSKSLGDTRVRVVLEKESSEELTENDYYDFAVKENFAKKSKIKKIVRIRMMRKQLLRQHQN